MRTVGALFTSAVLIVGLSARPASAQEPCSGASPIVCENSLAGTPQSEWDIDGAGDPSIQGFATDISVAPGQRLAFKIDTDATAYRLEIYRVGYYGGHGARRIATIDAVTPLAQPGCLYHVNTGLVDCGNWLESASWLVPAEAVSGVYFARAVRSDTGGASHIPFIVRELAPRSEILVQVADTTWQAYNDYGGNSLYVGRPVGRAFKVSYNRPLVTRGNEFRRTSFWATAYPMVRWLESNGYDVSYTTGLDTHRDGASLLGHKMFLSVGHDEYWSAQQRWNVEAARDAGVHLAFFSGNTMFWRTRWEPSIDDSRTPHRTLVSYKDTHGGTRLDPEPGGTGTWRDPRFGHSNGAGRPENALLGTLFIVNCCRFDAITVSAQQGRNRLWRNTPLATQAEGGSMTVGHGIVGVEWDGDVDNGHRPPGLIRLSNTVVEGADVLVDYGSIFHSHTEPVAHNVTMYRHSSGAIVFSTGTINWGWALDSVHDDPDGAGAPVDMTIQQATVNLFADMGVQPATLREGLQAAAGTTDDVPPTARITWPSPSDAEALLYRRVTIRGDSVDEHGVTAAVEVSIDGGTSWRLADGVSPWTYSFRPTQRGVVNVLARAVDDSGNLQPYPTWARFEVGGLGLRRLAVAAAGPAVLLVGALLAALWWAKRRRARRLA